MSNETNDGARIEDLERRLAKAEEQLAKLMAWHDRDEMFQEFSGDLERLSRGENLNAIRSVAAADVN
jgi:hypothetical protein